MGTLERFLTELCPFDFEKFQLFAVPFIFLAEVSKGGGHKCFTNNETSHISEDLDKCIKCTCMYLAAFSVSICFSIICLWTLILTIIFIICLFLYELNMLFSFLGICFYMNTSIFSPVIYSPGRVTTFKFKDHNHQRR